MLQYENIEQCGQKGLAMPGKWMQVDDRYVVGASYGVMTHGTIESFMYMSSLRRSNSITSKVISHWDIQWTLFWAYLDIKGCSYMYVAI